MNIDLDNLEDVLFDDDDDFSGDNSHKKRFITFFDFLPELKQFTIELDKVHLTIEKAIDIHPYCRIDTLNLDLSKIKNIKDFIINGLKSEIPLSNLGYKDIRFGGVSEHDSEFLVEIERVELDDEWGSKYYSLEDILSFLEDRNVYILKVIDTHILNIVARKLKSSLWELQNIKENYLRGNVYNMEVQFNEEYRRILDNHIEIFNYYTKTVKLNVFF